MNKLSRDNIFRIILWLLMIIGGAIVSIHFDKIYFYDFFNNTKYHFILFIPGYFLLKAVLKVSRNTGRYLAKKGREGAIPRLQTNRLVTTGVYGCMRHPMHLGLLFFPLAFALLIGSPTFILFVAPFEMLLMLLLIKFIEEPQAKRKFGKEYEAYQKQVPFFNFSSDCLHKLFYEDNSETEN